MVAIPVAATVIIALMALLLLYGLREFGKALASIFPSSINLLVASIHPRAWIEGGVDALAAGITWIVGDVIRPMINLVLGPIVSIINFVEALAYHAEQAASAVWWIVNDGIPQAVSRLNSLAWRLYEDGKAFAAAGTRYVDSLAWRLYETARGLVAATAAQLSGAIHYYYNGAIREIRSVDANLSDAIHYYYKAAVADAAALVRTAEADLTREIAQASGTAAGAVSTAEAYTKAAVAGALVTAGTQAATTAEATVGALVTDVDNTLAPAVTGVIDDVGSLVGVLGTDFPDVSSVLRELDLSKVGSLAGGLLGALSITRALTRLAEDCTVPNCRNLSKYGRDLQALLGVVEGAAFLGLITDMVRNPEPTAVAIEGALGSVARDTAAGVRDLIGV